MFDEQIQDAVRKLTESKDTRPCERLIRNQGMQNISQTAKPPTTALPHSVLSETISGYGTHYIQICRNCKITTVRYQQT